MKSAFWAARHPGYRRKSASSVIHTAAIAASTAAAPTSSCHDGVPSRPAARRAPTAGKGRDSGLIPRVVMVDGTAALTLSGPEPEAQAPGLGPRSAQASGHPGLQDELVAPK